jgi:hypothetical protein
MCGWPANGNFIFVGAVIFNSFVGVGVGRGHSPPRRAAAGFWLDCLAS